MPEDIPPKMRRYGVGNISLSLSLSLSQGLGVLFTPDASWWRVRACRIADRRYWDRGCAKRQSQMIAPPVATPTAARAALQRRRLLGSRGPKRGQQQPARESPEVQQQTARQSPEAQQQAPALTATDKEALQRSINRLRNAHSTMDPLGFLTSEGTQLLCTSPSEVYNRLTTFLSNISIVAGLTLSSIAGMALEPIDVDEVAGEKRWLADAFNVVAALSVAIQLMVVFFST